MKKNTPRRPQVDTRLAKAARAEVGKYDVVQYALVQRKVVRRG